MEERPVEYFSYLLRMWRTGEHSAWRASLEDPRTGERVGFNGLDTLFTFLAHQTHSILGAEQKDEDVDVSYGVN